ncbi:MAG: hypothetical protein LBC99_00645 [Spirochaetota bacterium]|jgi:hypothetical protein|nr:hypothetical protein [Spirochaetota bacterium]
MKEKPAPQDTTQELKETLIDAQASLDAARAELLQTEDAAIRTIIGEEIDAIMEEIALLKEELRL